MEKVSIYPKTLEKKYIFILSSILFKFLLEFIYINFVNVIYEYKGFNLDASIDKYLESWLIYLLFLSFTSHILERTSYFVINFLFFSYLSPLLVFYSLSNAARHHLYIVLTGILIIYIFCKGKKIKFPKIKHGYFYSLWICIFGVIIVSLWMIFSGGLIFFNLDLFFAEDVVLEILLSVSSLLNSAIIFSASFVFISLEIRLIVIQLQGLWKFTN